MDKVTFRLQPAPTFTVPVDIPRHGQEPAKIRVTFKHKTREGLDDFLKRSTKAQPADDWPLAQEMIESWEGPDVPFSEEAVRLLVENYQGAMSALVNTYVLELTQARRKN